MSLLLDTNILLSLTKNSSLTLIKKINPTGRKIFVSVASIAEIRSLAIQNNWGAHRTALLEILLDDIVSVDINESLIEPYVKIDSYSQCKNPDFDSFPHISARNMGKNDLWIAATATFLNLTLITTDKDFDHLDKIFFRINKVLPEQLRINKK